ncbi:MAG: histidine kinase [Bacteroidetes bacterium]|nr:histidine kinase [Bacteroidota bacterium]
MRSFRFISVIILFIAIDCVQAQVKQDIDSLYQRLNSTLDDTARIGTLSRLSNLMLKTKQVEKADSLIEVAEKIIQNKNLSTPYTLHWARFNLYFEKKELEKALEEIEITISQLEAADHKHQLAKARNYKAMIFLYWGRFKESIEVYEQNIAFIKKHKLDDLLPSAYSGLSHVYRNIGNIEEMRKTLVFMADAASKTDNDWMEADAWFRLGDIGMEYDSNFVYAIQQYKRSLKIYKQLQDSAMTAFLILRIGWNQYLNGDLDSALNSFLYSLEYSLPINRLTAITNAYGNIGTIYRDKKAYSKAIDYYKKSIEYSHKAHDWYNLSWLHEDMAKMFANMGKYKAAYENHILHKKFSDSLEMRKYNAQLTQARTKYETEAAKQQLELLTLKLNQHKFYTYGFAGLIIIAVVIGFLVFRQIRVNSKRKITEMNHKISEITQKNLRQQMNPHFIFNTLNSIQYYMYQHDKISTNNYLTKFSMLMRKTLENSQHTAIPIKDELDALELYLELESLRFKEKFDYKIEVDEDIDVLIHKIPTMLIQPYVENAICHGLMNKEDKGFLHVGLKLKEGFIACTIEDNGVGREAAMEIKETKNKNHNSLGTKITESRLNLVNSLYGKNMKIEYTDLKNDAGEASGTRVVIQIPVMT